MGTLADMAVDLQVRKSGVVGRWIGGLCLGIWSGNISGC